MWWGTSGGQKMVVFYRKKWGEKMSLYGGKLRWRVFFSPRLRQGVSVDGSNMKKRHGKHEPLIISVEMRHDEYLCKFRKGSGSFRKHSCFSPTLSCWSSRRRRLFHCVPLLKMFETKTNALENEVVGVNVSWEVCTEAKKTIIVVTMSTAERRMLSEKLLPCWVDFLIAYSG